MVASVDAFVDVQGKTSTYSGWSVLSHDILGHVLADLLTAADSALAVKAGTRQGM